MDSLDSTTPPATLDRGDGRATSDCATEPPALAEVGGLAALDVFGGPPFDWRAGPPGRDGVTGSGALEPLTGRPALDPVAGPLSPDRAVGPASVRSPAGPPGIDDVAGSVARDRVDGPPALDWPAPPGSEGAIGPGALDGAI
jgi:hypothetical protein